LAEPLAAADLVPDILEIGLAQGVAEAEPFLLSAHIPDLEKVGAAGEVVLYIAHGPKGESVRKFLFSLASFLNRI
jgi:hypothetical protein